MCARMKASNGDSYQSGIATCQFPLVAQACMNSVHVALPLLLILFATSAGSTIGFLYSSRELIDVDSDPLVYGFSYTFQNQTDS